MDERDYKAMNEELRKETPIEVIPVSDKPFTVHMVRNIIVSVATGRINHSQLTEQLNNIANKFYKK